MNESTCSIFFFGFLTVLSLPFFAVYFPQLTKEVIVGIDLGTTFSVLAVCIGGHVQVINHTDNSPLLPSYVYFASNGKPIVGHEAKELADKQPERVVYDAKRLIGRNFLDPTIQEDIKSYPFPVTASNENPPLPLINVLNPDGTALKFSPINISSMVLASLRDRFHTWMGVRVLLGWKLRSVTVSVPANFDNAQKYATLQAGYQAGFSSVQLVTEPVAAALAYRLNQQKGVSNVLVFDWGGGTLDVALLVLDREIFQVVTTAGNPHLGGEDVDRLLSEHIGKEIEAKFGAGALASKHSMSIIKKVAERLKIELSTKTVATINIPNVYKSKAYEITMTRQQFNLLTKSILDLIVKPVREVLLSSDTRTQDIGHVVLVGGSTRIPMVREMLAEEFPGVSLNYDIDPDQAVARGAALTRTCN